MAAFGSLSSLFESPLPESRRTFFESLSTWNQIKQRKLNDIAHLTEIFEQLNFEEKPEEPDISANSVDVNQCTYDGVFAAKVSKSLQLCTEGLGSESSDDPDDFMESGNDWGGKYKERESSRRRSSTSSIRNENSRRSWSFPPPISSIGRSGRPRICFRSYRQNGRFVLKMVRIPTQEFLHSSRVDGRLKLHFANLEQISEEEEGEKAKTTEKGKGEVEEEE